MTAGSFTFVLHSHMPYVLSHGESPHGSDWLCEAAAESYMPLLDTFERLAAEGISPRVAIGLTPILIEQLADPRFRDAFDRYARRRIEMAQGDEKSFREQGNAMMADLAAWWADWYTQRRREFVERWSGDIPAAFGSLQRRGQIEIIASSATHGYSPLLGQDSTLAAQVGIGVGVYAKRFGAPPRGYWLPECGYRPRKRGRRGVEEALARNGIEYFFAETPHHSSGASESLSSDRMDALTTLLAPDASADPQPQSPYYPLVVNSTRARLPVVQAFFRDPATGVQVWSGVTGYPGDPWYLDFHKRNSQPGAIPLGLRYWRVTAHDDKHLYEPDRAHQRVLAHAEHFAGLVKRVLAEQAPGGDGIVCATYDTELFGHWWFEGPQFLDAAIRAIARRPDIVRVTCGGYLDAHAPQPPKRTLREGSWGAGGNHSVWFNDANSWVWPRIWNAEATFKQLLAAHADNPAVGRLLAQAARELLLLTSSDWPFLITTGSARDYAEWRFNDHCSQFDILAVLIDAVAAGEELTTSHLKALDECEARDRIFSDIDMASFGATA